MTKNKLFQNRFVMLAFYVISLLPLWLPWFGFDPEVDGLRSGIETINPIILVILVIAMMDAFSLFLLNIGEWRRLSYYYCMISYM